jgi:hypothetical protein
VPEELSNGSYVVHRIAPPGYVAAGHLDKTDHCEGISDAQQLLVHDGAHYLITSNGVTLSAAPHR